MLVAATVGDLTARAGTILGHSDWVTIDQQMVDAFAALSGDDHWIHVDVERASREMPGGRTIAHGLFLLSLIPRLQRDIYRIEKRGIGLNYGYNRIRFVSPVPVGSRVRLALALEAVDPHEQQGTRLITTATIEIEGSEKPALVAENILLIKAPANG
jgi:acyl dehydratase